MGYGKKGMFRAKGPRKKKAYAPYRSALEKRISLRLVGCDYEPKESKVDYTTSHTYTPDFVPKNADWILLEVKGFFEASREAMKYVAVRDSNSFIEVIFIFSNPNKKAYPGCRVRKDGTILTMAGWCQKHKFLYYSELEIPQPLCDGTATHKWVKSERKKRGY